MQPVLPNEKLIVSEKNIKAGTIGNGGVNRAYDLYLLQTTVGEYTLVVYMIINFIFKDNGCEKWTFAEKHAFVQDWKNAIETSWDKNRIIRSVPELGRIRIDFRFSTIIEGCMEDHWEVTIIKMPKGEPARSYMKPVAKEVFLDSEDMVFTPKGYMQKQRGSVHEFGHMLGLEDEYQATSEFESDYKSVMNRGETILARHDAFINWLDKKIAEGNLGSNRSIFNRGNFSGLNFG